MPRLWRERSDEQSAAMAHPMKESMTPAWLAFSRSYVPSWRREISGQVIQPVGAHAFLGENSRSICNSVERERADGPAVVEARRCINCVRKLQRIAGHIAEQTRHDVAASVARHAKLELQPIAEHTAKQTHHDVASSVARHAKLEEP